MLDPARAEVAVELGQLGAPAGGSHRERTTGDRVADAGLAEGCGTTDRLRSAPSQPVLVFGGRELRLHQAGVMAADDLPVGIGCVAGQPARRCSLGGRSEVAARYADHEVVRCVEHRHEVAVGARGTRRRRGQPGGASVGVGDQRVGGGRRWKQPICCTEHDHEIRIECDGAGQRTDRDARADPAEAAGCHVELGGEDGPELAAPHRWTDRIEVTHPVEHASGVFVSQALCLVEAAQQPVSESPRDLVFAPVCPLAPRAGGPRVAQIALEALDEIAQLVGGLGVAFCRRRRCRRSVGLLCPCPGRSCEPGEPRPPVLGPIDACFASDAFPSGQSDDLSVLAARRDVGEQVEQVAAAQLTPIDVEQVEQEARHQALGDQRARSPVPRQPGSVEMMLDEAGVGPIRRPHDRHTREWCAGPGMFEHDTHRMADLVVGIGSGDHDRNPGALMRRHRASRHRAEPFGERDHLGVDGCDTGVCEEHLKVCRSADRREQVEIESARWMWQEDDHPFEPCDRAGLQPIDRASQQIALVVPFA